MVQLRVMEMSENWIVPCNAKRFDVLKHFETHDIAVWKNSFTIKVGDTVYLYLSAPYGEIQYRCKVISDQGSEELMDEHSVFVYRLILVCFHSP